MFIVSIEFYWLMWVVNVFIEIYNYSVGEVGEDIFCSLGFVLSVTLVGDFEFMFSSVW